jgi:hypothetical protein
MRWQEDREHYPHQWLLTEAITAHSAGDRLEIIEQRAGWKFGPSRDHPP